VGIKAAPYICHFALGKFLLDQYAGRNQFPARLSGTYDYGGRTTIDGVRSDDLENNSRVGVTLVLPVNRNSSIKLFASTDVHTSTGSDFSLVGIVWQYRWGHGL